MEFVFSKLSQPNALDIADNWKYDGEYSFYDMTEDIEDYEVIKCVSNGGMYEFLTMTKTV